MSIEDYISSGKLRAYVRGSVPEEERFFIERDLLRFPQLRQEVRRIRADHETKSNRTQWRQRAPLHAEGFRNFNPDNSIAFWRVATIAAVCLGLMATYFVVEYRSQLNDLKASLADQTAQYQMLAEEYQRMQQSLIPVISGRSAYNNPSYRKIMLYDSFSGEIANVFWNPRTGEVLLHPGNLSRPDSDYELHLWGISAGKVKSAGAFVPESGIVKMEEMNEISAFLITRQRRGDVALLTPETFVAIGATGL